VHAGARAGPEINPNFVKDLLKPVSRLRMWTFRRRRPELNPRPFPIPFRNGQLPLQWRDFDQSDTAEPISISASRLSTAILAVLLIDSLYRSFENPGLHLQGDCQSGTQVRSTSF